MFYVYDNLRVTQHETLADVRKRLSELLQSTWAHRNVKFGTELSFAPYGAPQVLYLNRTTPQTEDLETAVSTTISVVSAKPAYQLTELMHWARAVWHIEKLKAHARIAAPRPIAPTAYIKHEWDFSGVEYSAAEYDKVLDSMLKVLYAEPYNLTVEHGLMSDGLVVITVQSSDGQKHTYELKFPNSKSKRLKKLLSNLYEFGFHND